jgi:hypothetical protein
MAYITAAHAPQHEAKSRHDTNERQDRIDHRVRRHAGPAPALNKTGGGRTYQQPASYCSVCLIQSDRALFYPRGGADAI